MMVTGYAEMKPGFCRLKVTARYRKYKGSVHMVCLTNPISQPSFEISPIWIPFISKEAGNLSIDKVPTISQDLHVYLIFIWRFHFSSIKGTDHKQAL
jgi:hypothetical protein